ncbi:hypothetical protein NDU88_003793 [Pleurodeles waltl]|uniref:Uncharacterized protein n=1 Tax=Pleurodeles waltl TaxID=8319 RepID=A0AAV7SGW9_PLEWA|nr:hypothetical protein NDU88_003793 [Pleurodeles waltl]
MPRGKTLGPDVLLEVFHSKYPGLLAPCLADMYHEALEQRVLPDTTRDELAIFLLKTANALAIPLLKTATQGAPTMAFWKLSM